MTHCLTLVTILLIYPLQIHNPMSPLINNQDPLTPAVFHILLAIGKKERHGYDIMKQVEEDTRGKVTMGPGTLYGSIKRMLESNLIERVNNRRIEKSDDERRVYYRLTTHGLKTLNAEIERYKEILLVAQSRKFLNSHRLSI